MTALSREGPGDADASAGVRHLIIDVTTFGIFAKGEADDGAECTVIKFSDDRKLRGVADPPEGCTAIQMDFNRLEKRTDRNVMQFNKGKEKSCTWAGTTPGTSTHAGAHPAGKQFGRKGAGSHPGGQQVDREPAVSFS